MRRYSEKRIEELLEKYGTPIGFKDNIPIFKAIMRNDNSGHIRMFCSYCKYWHLHGYSNELGHRVAHCIDQRVKGKWQNWYDSPFGNHGYYIILVDEEEKD